LLTGLPSLAWSHRKSPAPSARARRITACDSRESSKSICKEIALQRPKTGKFDYLSGPNHPAHSIAFKFFTNDLILAMLRQQACFRRGFLRVDVEGVLPQAVRPG